LFRLYGDSLFCLQQQKSKQKNAAPSHKPSLKSNEDFIVTRNLCGCCGTHELKSEFAQTSSQKAPHKSLSPQLVQWGGKSKAGVMRVWLKVGVGPVTFCGWSKLNSSIPYNAFIIQ